MLQESPIFYKFDPADRFIPQRSSTGRVCEEVQESSNNQESILSQDVSQNHLQAYKKHLQAALNVKSRLLTYSRRLVSNKTLPCEQYHWPTRCRKRLLISKPHHLLDMPNFRAHFFLNQLDWAPSPYLVAALHNTVYLYAVGYEPIHLTWFERGMCSAIKWNCTADKVLLGTDYSVVEVWSINPSKLEKRTVCDCSQQYQGCVINSLAWHPNNMCYVIGCSRGTLCMDWLDTRAKKTFQLAHEGEICALKSSPDGRLLASAGEDGMVKVRNWRTMQVTLDIRGYSSAVRAIAWHPWRASCLVIGGTIKGTASIIVWNVNKRCKEVQWLDSGASVCSVEFSPVTGELVASVSISGSTSVILVMKNLNTVVDRMECDSGKIYHMLWSSDGKELDATKKCYDELGCLVTNRVWFHPQNRPDNPEPASRHTVKTQFVYYTRDKSKQHE